MFKAHLASHLFTTLTLQLFRAIFLLHLSVRNDEDSFMLDLNQHLGEQLKRFPLGGFWPHKHLGEYPEADDPWSTDALSTCRPGHAEE